MISEGTSGTRVSTLYSSLPALSMLESSNVSTLTPAFETSQTLSTPTVASSSTLLESSSSRP